MMNSTHVHLIVYLVVIAFTVVDSNPGEVPITFNDQDLESGIRDYPDSLLLVVQGPTLHNREKTHSYTTNFHRTNISRLRTLTFQNDTDVTEMEFENGAFYRYQEGHGFLYVLKGKDMQYKVRGQFCIDKLKVTVNKEDVGVRLHTVRVGKQHVKLSKCKRELSENIENHPSYRFPRQKLVHVTQRNRRHTTRYRKRGGPRVKRNPVEIHTVELLIVVDHEAYLKWQQLFGIPDNITTLQEIKQYYSYIFNGVDLRFRSVENPQFEINMAFSGFIVAQTEEESFWTSTSTLEDQLVDSTRLMINASEALEKFQVWLDDEAAHLPQYDHAILFTGGDLTYAGNTGNTGLAFAGSMCRNISNSSIVEEAFDFRTVTYATRQLARSLGARDDMDNNDCLEFFNFIMAPKFKLPVKSFPTNRWKFSTCTVQYFKDYIAKINEDELYCLQEIPLDTRYPADTVLLIQELPGMVYTARHQCQNVHGNISDVCRALMKPSDYTKLCTGLPCTVPDSDVCNYILPADGTPCGNMKYCFEGQCLEFEDAEQGDDECAFGDDPESFCKQKISSEPFLCYTETVRYSCCDSCGKVEIGLPGCEYGDRQMSCEQEDCTSGNSSLTETACCLTCSDGPVPSPEPMDDWFTLPTTSDTQSTTRTLIASTSVPSQSSHTSVTLTDISTNTVTTTSTMTELLGGSSLQTHASDFTDDMTSNGVVIKTSLFTKATHLTKSTPTTSGSTSTMSSFTASTPTTQLNPSPFSSEATPTMYMPSSRQTTTPSSVKPTTPLPIQPPPKSTSVKPSTTAAVLNNSPTTKGSSIHSVRPTMSSQTFTDDPLHNQYPDLPSIQSTKKTDSSTTTVRCSKDDTTKSNPAVTGVKWGPTASRLDCGKLCKGFEQASSLSGSKFTIYDRMFFKELARSMRHSQRRISQRVQSVLKHLYLGVTRQIQRHQESDTESVIYSHVVNPHMELPSQDDDDINRMLIPIWRHQNAVLLRNVEHDIKQMRYQVLRMVNRHLRH